MNREKAEKLRAIQDATYVNMLAVLEKYHMCNVERPTGFGKTKLFMQYAADHPNNQFLYIYDVRAVPESIEKNYAPKNVQFLSYAKLSRKSDREKVRNILLNINYRAVIFDESHLMGGDNIQELVLEVIPKIVEQGRYIIGGTATPARMDLVNVTDRFFGGHATEPYTLEDAFADGIITPPYWTAMIHLGHLLSELRKKCGNNPFQLNRLRQLDLAYAKLVGAPQIYHDTVVEQFGQVPSYMKFIAFYPTIKSLNDSALELRTDFEQAFPGHAVTLYPVSSDPEHFNSCVPLDSDAAPDNHIDLVLAVDMLNQSYHSSTLTGIIMNRATLSNIVFTQQLGRCLSVMAENQAIVFDNVGNAKINPLEAINVLQEKLGDECVVPSAVHRERDHLDLTLHVRPEILQVSEWYSRIKATSEITQEQVDYAKMARENMGAPYEWIEEAIGVPQWMLEGEEIARQKVDR